MAKPSSASLAVVTPAFGRPDPPAELSAAEAELWRSVVATKPGEWFTRDTFPLLTAYCRAAVSANAIAVQVDAFQPEGLEDAEGLKRYDKLMRMAQRQAQIIATLATKMRLAQQSRYEKDRAATLAKPAAANRPWEKQQAAR